MNEMLSSAYLDVLPAHPRPQPLESLNSYVKRIACANGIHHLNTFSHLTGVREPKHWLELRPAPDYGQLGTVTCCTDTELLVMTVYFLGHKFGREQSLGRFLAPNLSRRVWRNRAAGSCRGIFCICPAARSTVFACWMPVPTASARCG
jgi:hypothetical protein